MINICESCGPILGKVYPHDGTFWCKACMQTERWPLPIHPALFSSGKDDWETPDDLFNRLDSQYHFILDAAANRLNTKCSVWYGPGGERENALVVAWPLDRGNIWLNPPYSRGLQTKFVQKALRECYLQGDNSNNHVVCLLPARTDTKLFHETILNSPAKVEFLKGRVKFKGGKSAAPFPSMIVVF